MNGNNYRFAPITPLAHNRLTGIVVQRIPMKEIYQEIIQELDLGHEVVLATIINQKGSAPRTQGTKFLIRPDGSFVGTIGGGRLEATVLTEAPSIFSQKKNRVLFFRLKGEEVAETEMICGGEVDIYLEHFSGQDPGQRDFFQKILEVWEKGRSGLMITQVETGSSAELKGKKFLYVPVEGPAREYDSWIVPVIEHLPQDIKDKQPRLLTTLVDGQEKNFFLEPLIPLSVLYIFGAGHISLTLCRLGKMVGFRVVVMDDRIEFANPKRFPEADEIVASPFEEILKGYPFGPNAFIVIVTRGHLHDHQILRTVLKNPPRYVGMIGSRHKSQVVFKALREEGFSEEQLRSVYTPIGLDIKAETPEEIAVSITAELIQVRGQGGIKKKAIKT